MLEELAESQASGDIAAIYAQIREHTALPYVSSLQRHLATRPDWLEWAWELVGPLFHCGLAQSTAWRIASELRIDPLPVLSDEQCGELALQVNDRLAIRQLADSFVRVSPTNLVFSGIVLALLDGKSPGEGDPVAPRGFKLPAVIEQLPSLVDITTLDHREQAVLMKFATQVNDKPFIPGLYRMLAHWPPTLEYLSSQIPPLFSDLPTTKVCNQLAQAIDDAVPELLAVVKTPSRPRPSNFASDAPAVRAAIMRYRETSPQMVVFGTLIRDMIPTP